MHLRLAASAAFAIASCLPGTAWSLEAAPAPLTLDEAFARVARVHPELKLFGPQTEVLLAEREQAALKPPLRASLEVENVLGTGATRGFDAAEVTLSLAGVLERGGKLDARRALAQSRIDALSVQREAQRLDLLAETARRYLAAAAARDQGDIGRIDVEQRRRTVAAARHRHQAGASPESVVLTAEAALARAELAVERAAQQEQAARQHLAALWGERDPAFGLAAADPLALPPLVELDELAAWLERTPELLRFADEQRVGEARLQLARSATAADLDWQVGVRRLQESGDTALVGSLSLPLGPTHRAGPEIRAAEAGLAALAIERESRDVAPCTPPWSRRTAATASASRTCSAPRRTSCRAWRVPNAPPNAPTRPAPSATWNGRSCSPSASPCSANNWPPLWKPMPPSSKSSASPASPS